MLGCLVKLNLVQDSTHLLRWEYAVEACSIIGVKVVLPQSDLLNPRIKQVNPVANVGDVVSAGASFDHCDIVLARRGFPHYELAADVFQLVFVVDTYRRERTGELRWSHPTEQLFARFTQADYSPLQIAGECIDLNHVLHQLDKLGVGLLGDAP
jgi:hypothetical protein